ncbi:MAG: HAMP domain-containing protein [Saprospiraceae bacterium]|nr:HAMP domain-containing protein [Saprospiraceae bacterium]
MKIRTKLALGVGFLFLLIIILIGVGIKYSNQLSGETQNILKDNYNSIDYCRNMLVALDKVALSDSAKNYFQQNLIKQQNNVTEISEQQSTTNLTVDFEKLKSNTSDRNLYINIRKDLADVMLVNMQAIERKSEIAKETAKSATIMLSAVGTFCFLLAFTLLINLPSSIANPIKELNESVKEIAAKNYSQRVHLDEHNEFGELSKSFNVMAEKLQEYNESNLAKLMIEKRRVETLINNMHDPVIGLDENHCILFINNEALKISGLKRGETVGKSAQNIAVYNDLIRSLIQDVLKPNSSTEKQQQPLKIFADNKESYFEKEIIPINITPTGEKEEIQIGIVILLRNITSYKELDFAKTNFIATISHELKTPIASIKMSLDLLENKRIGNINEEQKQLIKSVREDSERLLKITGELLDITQAETGKIQLRFQKTSPLEIINYALDAVKIPSEQKGITIETSIPNAVSDVNADGEKTAWVVINLLTNAIRHSYENSKVLLSITETSDKVHFTVKDFGKGIDTKYQSKIFDRYYLVPETNQSGTGLGLAICKEFIEAQGGEISLQSEIGKGSVFAITLNKVII